MFRIWAKIYKENRLIKDTTYCEQSNDTRTHKVFRAMEEISYEFDLEKPIWLASNISEFQQHARTRFRQDSYIETVPFDYLEIQVIEED